MLALSGRRDPTLNKVILGPILIGYDQVGAEFVFILLFEQLEHVLVEVDMSAGGPVGAQRAQEANDLVEGGGRRPHPLDVFDQPLEANLQVEFALYDAAAGGNSSDQLQIVVDAPEENP